MNKKRIIIGVPLTLLAAALAGWILFHPYRQVEIGEMPARARVFADTRPFGARFDAKISHATLSVEGSFDGAVSTELREQEIDVPAPGIARKTTHSYGEKNRSAIIEEQTRLMVGPLIVFGHYRRPLSIVGDLLPFAFWSSNVLREIVVQRNSGFPDQIGGEFNASYTTDDLHSDGSLAKSARDTIACRVTAAAKASQYLATLQGDAFIYTCTIRPLPERKEIESVTENVYFPALGWAFTNAQTIRYSDLAPPVKYKTTLVAIR